MSVNELETKTSQAWEESVDHATAISLAASYVPGSPEEKRLLWKLDLRIIVRSKIFIARKMDYGADLVSLQPCCWLLFVLGFLDRGNIGLVFTSEGLHCTRYRFG